MYLSFRSYSVHSLKWPVAEQKHFNSVLICMVIQDYMLSLSLLAPCNNLLQPSFSSQGYCAQTDTLNLVCLRKHVTIVQHVVSLYCR